MTNRKTILSAVRKEKIAMDSETHELSFPADQPETILKPLLALLQANPEQKKAGASRTAYLLDSQSVLLIDNDKICAGTIAQLVNIAGYHSVIVETPLEAFTLFLQGRYIPTIILLGQNCPPNHLFLQRLLQQILLKYGRRVPLVRL